MKKDVRLLDNAKAMRREMTPTEKLLWEHLRGKRFGGSKFRRQQVIGAYIVDFFCPSTRLVIELDGESHLEPKNNDASRDEWLAQNGYKVLRFWNTEVFECTDAVLEMIWRECEARAARC